MPDDDPRRRAPGSGGPRTTLRLPPDLAEVADRLADALHVSRNDAVLRLAKRGADLYERERQIDEVREQRWAAVLAEMPEVDDGEDAPTAEEAYEAIMNARIDLIVPPE